MTAARVMDVIARLLDCAGQAADAVPAHTQVKMEDAPRLLPIPVRMSRYMDTSSTTQLAKIMVRGRRPVVPLERNLYGHPLAAVLSERQLNEVLFGLGWGKIPNWERMFVHQKQVLFLSVYVDDIKLAGKKQKVDPMWKELMKLVDLGEPTSSLDHVYLGCTQRECNANKCIIDQYFKCSNHEFLLLQLKSCQGGRNLTQRRRMVLRHGRTCSKLCREVL